MSEQTDRGSNVVSGADIDHDTKKLSVVEGDSPDGEPALA